MRNVKSAIADWLEEVEETNHPIPAYMKIDTIEAHKFSSYHRSNVEDSDCGCFYCVKTFHGSEIKEWIDGGKTALCPYCGINSVISSVDVPKIVDDKFRLAMHEKWFAGGYVYTCDGENIEFKEFDKKNEI